MIDPLQVRADALLNIYVESLPQDRYSFTKPSMEEGLYFAISKKNHNGQHWGRLRAMSLYEYRMLVSTSATDQEALARLNDYIMEGKGSFRAPEPVPSVPVDQVQAIVRAAVEQALTAQRLVDSVTHPRASPEASLAPHVPQAPTAKKDVKLIALWTERAKVLGIKEPKITSKGAIDGRWLMHAKQAWEQKQFADDLNARAADPVVAAT